MRILLVKLDEDGSELVDTAFQLVCADSLKIKKNGLGYIRACDIQDDDEILWSPQDTLKNICAVVDTKEDNSAYTQAEIYLILDWNPL